MGYLDHNKLPKRIHVLLHNSQFTRCYRVCTWLGCSSSSLTFLRCKIVLAYGKCDALIYRQIRWFQWPVECLFMRASSDVKVIINALDSSKWILIYCEIFFICLINVEKILILSNWRFVVRKKEKPSVALEPWSFSFSLKIYHQQTAVAIMFTCLKIKIVVNRNKCIRWSLYYWVASS